MRDSKPELVLDAAARAARYLAESDRPTFPSAEAIAALANFSAEVPEGPTDPAAVLDQLDRLGSPATVRSTHGRYFGFVNGGTEPAAAAAAVLASTWDQNVALPVMSPVAAHLDALSARWIVDLLGLPAAAEAAFCAGASVANLTAILAGRDALLARRGWDVGADGLAGAPPIDVVTSAEVHVSVFKALRAAGIGRSAVRTVATDDRGRLLADELPAIGDRTLLILQAGNVNTGHSDPFAEVIPAARAAGAWVHVDGAFGLWAAASPSRRVTVAGVELADSWATDAHKWLNAPYDAGVVICADGADLRRSMAVDAAYLETTAERAPMHLGLQMSQRARGVETWAVIAGRGRSGIAEMIDHTCDQAERMAAALAAGGAHILAPVVLNQVLVRFGSPDADPAGDAETDRVVAAVQADGTCWAGATTWQGRRAMRVSFSDTSITEADVDASAAAILRCANR